MKQRAVMGTAKWRDVDLKAVGELFGPEIEWKNVRN